MTSKRYRVTGTQPVDGHKPGDEFNAVVPAARERYLLTGGHLTLVQKEKHHDSGADAADSKE